MGENLFSLRQTYFPSEKERDHLFIHPSILKVNYLNVKSFPSPISLFNFETGHKILTYVLT